jgi:peptide/nickel transport system substrate-binding protein
MQRIFYEDAAYAVMWYEPVFSAWRGDRWEGFVPQPPPEGDPLEGWGGPSEVWWTLRPAGTVAPDEGGGGGGEGAVGDGADETRGIPAGVWLGGAAVLIVLIGAFMLLRRRRPDEDEA